MRAHANCVENLPVFGAIVFALYVSGVNSATANLVAVVILVARVLQSLVHVCFVETNTAVAVRFTFFFVQIAGFFSLIAILLSQLNR